MQSAKSKSVFSAQLPTTSFHCPSISILFGKSMHSQRLRFCTIGKTSTYTPVTFRPFSPGHHAVPSSMIRPRSPCQSSISLIRRSNQHSALIPSGKVGHYPVSSSGRSVRWKSSPTVSEPIGEPSTAASTKAKVAAKDVPQPTNVQLRNHFIGHSIPMVRIEDSFLFHKAQCLIVILNMYNTCYFFRLVLDSWIRPS